MRVRARVGRSWNPRAGAVYPQLPRAVLHRSGSEWGDVAGVPYSGVMAGNRRLLLEPLAPFFCWLYVGWLPLKFFVAPVSRLVFLAREVSEGLTRNAELGIIEGCR